MLSFGSALARVLRVYDTKEILTETQTFGYEKAVPGAAKVVEAPDFCCVWRDLGICAWFAIKVNVGKARDKVCERARSSG
jgi:hypothetical protein